MEQLTPDMQTIHPDMWGGIEHTARIVWKNDLQIS
jgi:hypothetical protein